MRCVGGHQATVHLRLCVQTVSLGWFLHQPHRRPGSQKKTACFHLWREYQAGSSTLDSPNENKSCRGSWEDAAEVSESVLITSLSFTSDPLAC